ncbi:unnamed protein product [Schistosoma margrebowiei]|uniref:Uncharacterized protein n=1 Tax=Schistosoma margrebowiei TaxID=48269 RepID=A0A3P7WTM2_9TREM|nr:unnamed protein product [Schistosoma margrebowiei]
MPSSSPQEQYRILFNAQYRPISNNNTELANACTIACSRVPLLNSGDTCGN